MKISAVRKFTFCAGHRVYQHESKCSNVHGHNYTLHIHAAAEALDSLGRVIDFSELKRRIDPWIQENWDHTFLYYEIDTEMQKLESLAPKRKPWFACSFNPTVENMAAYLLLTILPDLLEGTGITVVKIELWETENCKVEVTL